MPLRPAFLFAATAVALAAVAGCNPTAPSSSTATAPVVHTQVRTGVRPRTGARGGSARPHKQPMQTGPAQSSVLRDL